MHALQYPDKPALNPFLRTILIIVTSAAYSLCCLPSFSRIGHFAFQITIAILSSILCTAMIYAFIPRSLPIIANGLSGFLLFFLGIALYQEVVAQLESDLFTGWIQIFFYDKPLIVSIVWGTAFSMLLFLRLLLPMTKTTKALQDDFSAFFARASSFFIFFYICVLIYCFLLQRTPGTDYGLNLVPFSMIISYIRSASYAYESILYLVGNILCFLPFGFYYRVSKKECEWIKTISLPIVLSLLIEVSQILFKMGDFDVDDIIMNASGFFIGFFISHLFDCLRSKLTMGEEQSIFKQS